MTHAKQAIPNTPVAREYERAPLQRIKSQPWSFVGLALTVGVAAGFLLKFKTIRKLAGFYLAH